MTNQDEKQIDTEKPTKPKTAEEEFQELKSANMRAVVALNSYREPKDDLKVIRDALMDAAEKDRVGSDLAFAQFLYDDCAPGLCKKLAKERSGNMDVSIFLELSNLLHLHSGSKQLQIHKERS